MGRTLIQGGIVVTAVVAYEADLAVVDGKIAAIFGPGAAPAITYDRTIDAKGKYVLPGGIDAHTHLDMPFGGTTSSDDFETGTLAAAHGGTAKGSMPGTPRPRARPPSTTRFT
jgi:dihydropyrimidinase